MDDTKHRDAADFLTEGLSGPLPHNMQAEQSVLGAILLEPPVLNQLVNTLRSEMFYSAQNAGIYAEMTRLYTAGMPIDVVTVLDAVEKADIFSGADEAKTYLAQLAETVPAISNAGEYARIVQQQYRMRQLIQVGQSLVRQASESTSPDLVLESAEQKLYQLRGGQGANELSHIRDSILDIYTNLQNLSGEDRDKYLGIPTGFSYLDTMLTGLGRSDLIILAARPGMGKTSFALNIATNVAKKQKVPVAIFSLEMTKDQLSGRILSAEGGISSQAFRTGQLTGQEWDDLAAAANIMFETPIYMDDTSSITIPEMKAKILRINQDPSRPNVGVVIIDYLQLMSSGRRSDNRVQEISEITRNLKIMAKELNVPVIALSQLSRAAEKSSGRSDHRPVLSDLRDSGSIEQDADVVLFLYRPGYYKSTGGNAGENGGEEVDSRTAECIVAKNRHGEVGKVDLAWDGAHTRFTDVDYVHE